MPDPTPEELLALIREQGEMADAAIRSEDPNRRIEAVRAFTNVVRAGGVPTELLSDAREEAEEMLAAYIDLCRADLAIFTNVKTAFDIGDGVDAVLGLAEELPEAAEDFAHHIRGAVAWANPRQILRTPG